MSTPSSDVASQLGPEQPRRRQQYRPPVGRNSSFPSNQFASQEMPLAPPTTLVAPKASAGEMTARIDEDDDDDSENSTDGSELETIYDSKTEQPPYFPQQRPNAFVDTTYPDTTERTTNDCPQDEHDYSQFQAMPTATATIWNDSHSQTPFTLQTGSASASANITAEDEQFAQAPPGEEEHSWFEDLNNLIDLEDVKPSGTTNYPHAVDLGLSAPAPNNSNQHDTLLSDYLHETEESMVRGDPDVLRWRQDPHMNDPLLNGFNGSSKKRKRHLDVPSFPIPAKSHSSSSAQASSESRAQHMPGWMKYNTNMQSQSQQLGAGVAQMPLTTTSAYAHTYIQRPGMYVSTSIPMKPGYIPTWRRLLPREFLAARKEREEMATERKRYALSVLNVNEFTITGVSLWTGAKASSVQGLRAQIRKFSNEYGKAVFERDSDAEDGGKWRIPLGAYQALFSYLTSLPNTTVEGIPQAHLNIAMLGRQRLEKGCPSVRKMMHLGVPVRLAKTLAPFQRGGVDFVHERRGRALIADEMGLGKTIQAIASISMYHEDWPVLVLTPSGARYHWENEFLNWLGSANNDQKLLDFGNEGEGEVQDEVDLRGPRKMAMPPLVESQINVLTSGASPMIPNPDTKVVIVSYGLAPKLVEEGKLVPGMFKCAIVDESHMLKNKSSKRTTLLMPILSTTSRCILLSGTPAFARPMELWPQMNILGSAEDPSFTSEAAFVNKYVKGSSKNRLAELHTVLTGTLMIRRMKNDILKQLPPKVREQALVNIMDEATREEFRIFLEMLRTGNGALGKIARLHEGSSADKEVIPQEPPAEPQSEDELKSQVRQEVEAHYDTRRAEIVKSFSQIGDPAMVQMGMNQAIGALRAEVGDFFHRRLNELKSAKVAIAAPTKTRANASAQDPEEPSSKKAMLIRMYKRTGQIKIPLVADMLKMWLANPAKGKLCIFAHHISVLNEIGSIAGLSNEAGSSRTFIRIDGATNPKQRQEQINAFQKDPSIRVALLGITAAGVAVTLTAASTVWFAELFWTPALLIQAEDRCHRIGQQAKCRCLYIVAKGTLDEILWKHIEKKFRDLGEFVEGKEKMKIVVHKKYRGTLEVKKSLEIEKFEFDDEEEPEFDQGDEVADELESQLHQDLEELEREEQEMLAVDTEDDDGDGEGNGKASGSSACAGATAAGSTETEAICLSDDEEVEEAPASRKSLQEVGITVDREFPDLKLYKMKFPAPSCGLVIARFKGRVVVRDKADHLPNIGRPNVGDILLACNNDEIVPNVNLNALLSHFDALMQRFGEVEILFAEDQEFSDYFTDRLNSGDIEKDAFIEEESPLNGLSAKIASLPTYTIGFDGVEDYGFCIESIHSIIFVSSIIPSHIQHRGADAVPSVGDVLLSINGATLRVGLSVPAVMLVLNTLKEKGMTCQMTFAAADEMIVSMVLSRGNSQPLVPIGHPRTKAPPPPSGGGHEVIELLDD